MPQRGKESTGKVGGEIRRRVEGERRRMNELLHMWRNKKGVKSDAHLSRRLGFPLAPSPLSRSFILLPSSFIFFIAAFAFFFIFPTSSSSQLQRAPRIVAHSTTQREAFPPSC